MHGVVFLGRERDRERLKEKLGVAGVGGVLDALIDDALVCGVLVDDIQASGIFRKQIGVKGFADIHGFGKLMLLHQGALRKKRLLFRNRSHRLGEERLDFGVNKPVGKTVGSGHCRCFGRIKGT